MTDFIYTPDTINKLEIAISKERLHRYILSAGNSIRGLKLYLWNTALSEAIYGPLQHLEIVVRNAFHNQLSIGFGAAWYDSTSLNIGSLLIEKIHNAKHQMGKLSFGPSDVIAELNFGFWIGILAKRYDRTLWRTHLYKAFPNAPATFRRKQAHDALSRIRSLRNRVAHHEPIYHYPLASDYELIIEIVSWICPDTAKWVKHHNRFEEVWKNHPNQYL